MPALYVLIALFACNGCGERTPADLPAASTAPEQTERSRQPKGKGGGHGVSLGSGSKTIGTDAPAPSRSLWGLEVGSSDGTQIDAWLAEKGLDCPAAAQADKGLLTRTCRSGLTPQMLAGRTIDGKVDQLVLSSADGALKQITASRSFSSVESAIADYKATRTAIEKTLGPPAASKDISGPADFDGSLVRFNTAWGFGDLSVSVTANKSIGGMVTVSERWQTP